MSLAIESLLEHGQPATIPVITAVAATAGVEHLQRVMPEAHLWVGAVDKELTAKSYIVPGLGDAGDLSYGGEGTGVADYLILQDLKSNTD